MADYTIKAGDTLAAIAKANGTTVKNLMELNPQIKDANSIFANDKIKLSTDENPQRNLSIAASDVTDDGGIMLKGLSVEKQSPAKNEEATASKFLYAAGGAAAYKAAETATPYVKEGAIKTGQFVKENAEKAYDKTKKVVSQAKNKAVAQAKSAIESGKSKYQNIKDRLVKSAKGMTENVKQKVVSGQEAIMEKSAKAKTSVVSGRKKIMESVKTAAGKGTKVLAKAAPAVKLAGKVAKPLAVAYSAVEIADAYEEGGTTAAAKKGANVVAAVGGAWAGATAGASIGAAAGSIVPIVGTAAGAVIGGIVGSIGGWVAGDKISQKVLE